MALRWGIVSVGLISSDFTAVLQTLPRSEHQVVAVAARDLSRAKEFAQKHDIPKAYGSYEELAKDPNVEVAYVGTQHPQHKAAVMLCLAAGKAVLCEKPMGVNAAEVREMVTEARSRGLFLMEVRAEEAFQHLGNARTLRVALGQNLEETHPCSRGYRLGQAGVPCLDLGIYCVPKPEKISVMGRRPVIPLVESELLADILEEVRRAIGVTFPQDKH
uniref:Trans-1,2-dihydrobenzene-1,2-diol dehydrogenase n=1 Tax=Macaca nemestrina TaxID=9545 RepID=A0A2K6DXH8_MACNE